MKYSHALEKYSRACQNPINTYNQCSLSSLAAHALLKENFAHFVNELNFKRGKHQKYSEKMAQQNNFVAFVETICNAIGMAGGGRYLSFLHKSDFVMIQLRFQSFGIKTGSSLRNRCPLDFIV